VKALDEHHCWYVAMENNGGLTENDLGIPNNSTTLDSNVGTMLPFPNEMDVEFGGGLDDDPLPPLKTPHSQLEMIAMVKMMKNRRRKWTIPLHTAPSLEPTLGEI
jgi:hypothetical protein